MKRLLALLLLAALLPGTLVLAQGPTPLTRRAALERLVTAERTEADWFAPASLLEVPAG